MNHLRWAPSTDTTVVQYELESAPNIAGPWTTVTGSPVLNNQSNPAIFDGAAFFLDDAAGNYATVYHIRVRDNVNNTSAWSDPFWSGHSTSATVTAPDSRDLQGSEYSHALEATAAFGRTDNIITPDQLRFRYLPGIPLVAALPDPITKKRFVYTDDELKDVIGRACGRLEVMVGAGFHVTPVKVLRRVPFDRAEYRSLGFFRVPDSPILRLYSIEVKTADGNSVYTVPITWVDPGQFHKGQINLIPLMPATMTGGGVLPSFSSGGAAWLAILGQAGWVPSYWELSYDAGFNDGNLWTVVNEAIGLTAAIDVLDNLAATYRVASYSLGLDAASQSVSGPGPAIYDKVIERKTAERDMLVQKIKAKYFKKFVVDNV
jgi:hypothetical protein